MATRNIVPRDDLEGLLGTGEKRWEAVYAGNVESVYPNVAAMVADINLKAGSHVRTEGYYEPNDGGAGVYNIRVKEVSDVDDGGSIISLVDSEGDPRDVVAELITNNSLNVKQFGVMPTDTTTSALSKINTILALNKFSLIYIPSDINYGYDRHSANYIVPNVFASTIRVTVFDFSIDNSYVNEQTEYHGLNGNQLRIWSNTPHGEDGQHDGDLISIGAQTHPCILISNDGELGKRASIIFGTKRTGNWMIGQAIYQNDEDFRIDYKGEQVVFSIDKANRNLALGGIASGSYGCAIYKPVACVYVENDFLTYKNQHLNPTTSIQIGANGNSFYVRNVLLSGKKIFDFGNAINFYNPNEGSAKSLFIYQSDTKFLRIDVGQNDIDVGYGGNRLFKSDSNYSVNFPHGVAGGSGTTANRPAAVTVGTMFFDTTLNKPIWFKGNNVWVDATGATV